MTNGSSRNFVHRLMLSVIITNLVQEDIPILGWSGHFHKCPMGLSKSAMAGLAEGLSLLTVGAF